MSALASLKAGVAELLEAEGRGDLGALVRGADLEGAGPIESWTMGGRTVTAHRLALVADAAPFLSLTRADALAAVRSAFERATRTPETELADLAVVLRLPGGPGGWHRAYRDMPEPRREERPEPGRVLAGAAALLSARREARAAAFLERATLQAADVGATAGTPLVRYVVRLSPEDFAAADGDGDLADDLRQAVVAAATRAAERVASVDLAVRLPDGAV